MGAGIRGKIRGVDAESSLELTTGDWRFDAGLPRDVSSGRVMALLYSVAGSPVWARFFPEIATAIANASNTDPVFPGTLQGSEATACLLVADGWDSSRLHPYLIRGSRFGLYQIRQPIEPRLPPRALTVPWTASLFAVDLIRKSVTACADLPWEERLGWYKDLGRVAGPALPSRRPSALARDASRRILQHTRSMFLRSFSC
jgi:hypothetical protein